KVKNIAMNAGCFSISQSKMTQDAALRSRPEREALHSQHSFLIAMIVASGNAILDGKPKY
ncbi:MAG: hypothetical protein ABI659_03890, partial [Nitrosospira sp.]